ncbi:2,3-diaminopropionate biosynthesis protein SbnA [Bradyrhizobium ontarionense]|uniref:2,3-diaminopropionate biosynthesis protein SbnA n=1 Tax=Bradyrhizobium ontarionense TaxID=2898149 RepID=A0ABY3RL13_9BRAD|nr:2,3-diaminopropionate biosynthesis protein SbnA [Bradyrhizobium sp. A19]UFZ08161.1 2,3-diaminopropionate biosynthesis protein SbnA [Bradyrhizobium sp. A19]
MSILTNPLDLLVQNLFFELPGLVDRGRVVLKMEGYNVTGSIKIKPALFMIAELERRGLIEPHRSTIIESSSGNLGIALALICSLRGYAFICVTDPNVSAVNLRSIEAYGGRTIIVDSKDANGGYLETRITCIRDLLRDNSDYVWLNQYANEFNARAHEEWTALEILDEIPEVSHLYVGSGTTGTVMGLARRFAELSPDTMVVAVEPEGSVTFDPNRKGRRLIPGIGTSRRPELADPELLDRIVYVPEIDAIRMCHRLARRQGLLLGGSTGSVLAAIAADAAFFDADSTVVAISPDLGDKYMDTIYSPDWVRSSYGTGATMPDDGQAPLPCEPLKEIVARHSREVTIIANRCREVASYRRDQAKQQQTGT